jgi:hypothetical protein
MCVFEQFRYHMSLFGDFGPKVGRGDIFRLKIGNRPKIRKDSLRDTSSDTGLFCVAVTLWTCIQEVPGSNVGQGTSY